MELFRTSARNVPLSRASVISIGNFDGLHLGHQALLYMLREHAFALSARTTVITFEPHPQEYFRNTKASTRITNFREKTRLFQDAGIDRLICLRFDSRLAKTSATEFVYDCLVRRLGVRDLVVGEDFRFGKDRKGSVELLRQLGLCHNFEVTGMPAVQISGNRVSSSQIRQHLKSGELEEANKLLGRKFSFSGKVAYGDQRGRTWGFPTANLYPSHANFPLTGVFVVAVKGVSADYIFGIANLGRRPTVGGNRFLIEVHLFDFDQDIYGKRITIEFCHWVRSEQRFDSFDQLREQIQRDIDYTRDWVSGHLAK
ncbi:MAG: bifunctional riboflavin kinase/FMN adenylyltransferase [Acidiferrobacteraceae bacterium]|nr:bifunctional riboflavin kinase/FMN adenylyltransferase [Acidiferrobacteraceae bacterium]